MCLSVKDCLTPNRNHIGMSIMSSVQLLLLLQALAVWQPSLARTTKSVHPPLRIAAWNVQNLGDKKLNNIDHVEIISKVITEYDIILIQEIVTQKLELVKNLQIEVNRKADSDDPYELEISPRLGRTNNKEQYGFFYRKNKVSVVQSEVYPDDDDIFERPPFIVVFNCSITSGISKFAMAGIHTQPRNAGKEISALAQVYDYVVQTHKLEDVMFLGDFNAGCSNVRISEWENIDLWTREETFTWLITHEKDTTVATSSCPYDRIVIAGEKLKDATITNSAVVYRFDKKLGLSNEQALQISDHYAVEMKIRGQVSNIARTYIMADICFTVSDKRKSEDLTSVGPQAKVLGFEVNQNKQAMSLFMEGRPLEDLLDALTSLTKKFPAFLTTEAVETVEYKALYGALDDSSSFTEVNSPVYSITVNCDGPSASCEILMCKTTNIN